MPKAFANNEVAKLLREVAAAYEIKGGKFFFQARAYDTAAESIENAPALVKDLWEQGRLQSLPGIGGSIAQHLDELFRTGEVKHFKWVKKGLPQGMFAFLEVPGIGPKNAYKLARELNLKTIEDLKEACCEGRVAQLEGFGEVSQQKILQAVNDYLLRPPSRILLPVADSIAKKVIDYLEQLPEVKRIDPLGSLRRMAATVGDVDLAVATDYPEAVIEKFVSFPGAKRVITEGSVGASVWLHGGTRVDLRVQDVSSYGALLQHYTGSVSHNVHLRTLAQQKGLSLSEYGIRKGGRGGKLMKFATEEEFYAYLGMSWIPPEIREDTGEIEAALVGKLPNLVELSDIKGDLHVHCKFSLEESHDPGHASIEELARKALELGYQYIAIGNHSPSVSKHTQAQMRELILKKREALDKVQKNFPRIKLLNMVEVDILADNTLALNDENLKLFDVAIAGVHSSLDMDRERMTQRVLVALNNPYIHGLAHPTGRLLPEREGYELDWEKVFAACKKNNCFLEINAFYKRLDLPDLLVREAIRAGVKLAVCTDAHDLNHLDLMQYGVAVARRGWAEKKDIVNAHSY